MNKAGYSVQDIASAIGKTKQTVYNLRKISDEELLIEPNKNTRIATFDTEKLKQHFTDNPFDFNKEVGQLFNKSKNTIQRWRHKLGFKRKKAKTVYKEADEDLKKTS